MSALDELQKSMKEFTQLLQMNRRELFLSELKSLNLKLKAQGELTGKDCREILAYISKANRLMDIREVLKPIHRLVGKIIDEPDAKARGLMMEALNNTVKAWKNT